jgi:flagellin
MQILNGTDQVLLNINRNQDTLTTLSSHLSSGLRIENAADDPSGDAIAQTLQSKVLGLQQSVENVQNGTNLLTVADGAAATIQQILQRINSLIIESNSDINSNTQLQAIQDEINQELLEINRISSNANFNGITLFDGSHDTYVASPTAQAVITEVNPGLLPDGSTPTGDTVSDPENPAAPAGLESNAKLIQNPIESTTAGVKYFTGLFVFQVTSYSTNPTDPTLGVPLGQPGVILQASEYSTDPSFSNGQGEVYTQGSALPTGQGYDFSLITGNNSPGSRPATQPLPSGQSLEFDMPNLSANDVGTAIAFQITAPQQSGGGTALNINDGGEEGTTIAISLPTLSTSALGISAISVLRPTALTGSPGNITSAGTTSNALAAASAQLNVQSALQSISALRATLGSQIIATQDDGNNSTIEALNLTSSVSSIQDLNVGQATTQYAQAQILNDVGLSVLSSFQVNAKELTNLLIKSL